MDKNTIKNRLSKGSLLYKVAYLLYYYGLQCRQKWNLFRHRERKCSWGNENPDKIFYVIGVNYWTGGLFAIIKSTFSHILYAVDHGYIPVVDMQNYYTYLSDKEHPKAKNMWEFLFEQPCGYGMEDISRSKNIIKSSSLPYKAGYGIGFDLDVHDEKFEYCRQKFARYIVANEKTQKYVSEIRNKLFGKNMRVLGGKVRGTDYTDNRPLGHPIQPSVDMFIEKAKTVMQDGKYDLFFLATEDKRIHDKVRAALGVQVSFVEQNLYEGTMGKKYLVQIHSESEATKLRGVLDYYATICILAQCDGLIAGLNGGTIGACLMSKGYDYLYIWNLGMYE